MAARRTTTRLYAPQEIVAVTTSMPEPVYGCETGTRYPFDEHDELYMDVRDVACLTDEYVVL